MKKDENARNDSAQKGAVQVDDSGIGLAVGLSLGTLAGIVTDNIGLGMMLGVAAGLCAGAAVGVLRRNKKSKGQKVDNEKR